MITKSLLILAALAMPLVAAPQFFFGDPPDETHPWAQHDHNRPQPHRVEPPEKPGDPPSDAIVLFDGTEESFKKNWKHTNDKRRADWIFEDGAMQSMRGAGYIETKQEFGDMQLHVEWAAPSEVKGDGQGRGNSGVFLSGKPEVQVLDNYENPTYADGTAGAIYGVMPPMANALKAPGKFQSYDIIYRRPVYRDGKVVDEGSMTVICNGVVIQDSVPLDGGGGYRARTAPKVGNIPDKGPLKLQDHGNPVRFRNVWVRELRKRPSEGGSDGRLSREATAAKRAENARMMLDQASSLEGLEKMFKLFESLVYKADKDVLKQAADMADAFVKEVKSKPDELPARKGDVVATYRALKYMVEDHKLIPTITAFSDLDQLMDTNGWKKGR